MNDKSLTTGHKLEHVQAVARAGAVPRIREDLLKTLAALHQRFMLAFQGKVQSFVMILEAGIDNRPSSILISMAH